MKRTLLFLLLFMPILASAYDAEVDGIYYSLFPEKNVAKVTVSPSGYSGSVDIPEKFTYEGVEYSVTSIGALAFNSFGEYSNLTSVTIPNSVTRIEPEAFGGCSNLTSVTIPASVTDIAYSAFSDCNSLTSVHITDLEAWCRISFGSKDANPLYYAHHLYLNGKEVKDLVIPNSVTSLGRSVFYGCSGLTSLTIPSSVTSIEMYAFAECSGLTSVSIPNSLTSLGTGIFYGCSSLASVTIPNSVTSIGAYAFRECSSLTSVTIPNSVTQIAQDAFHDCSNLKEVYCLAENVPVLLSSPFQNCHPENITLYVPAASVDAYSNAEQWKDFGNIVALTAHDAYRPFLKEGKTWNMQEYYQNVWTGEQWTKDVSYVINGTTEIDGKTYYKMYRISEEGSKYLCALREENRKVWQYVDSGDDLLYDFGMSVGDSYRPSYQPLYFQLTAIKPMRFQYNQLLNVLHYDVSVPYDPTSPIYVVTALIVEGVGCEKGWNITELYAEQPTNGILHGEDFLSCYEDGECIFTADDFNDLTNPNPADNIAYRPFVEDGKVWKVGTIPAIPGNPVQVVDRYYFDGDTIIDGKTCKLMMCQRYVSPDLAEESPSLTKVGAWYEEDKKVYLYDEDKQSMVLMYDFSIGDNESLNLLDGYPPFIIGPKQTGGLEGFKGIYRDVMTGLTSRSTIWLEGVGGIDGPSRTAYAEASDHVPEFLMSCTVGDEVIYLNDKYEDGTTTENLEAKKHRFDFTHTIKTRPKAPRKNKADGTESPEIQSLYGEYSDLQLDINLYPLDEAYIVRIANESGNVVYEKAVNAGSIVALNIDISAYAKGRYTVTVDNSHETFYGEFDTQTTGIKEVNSNVTRTVQYYSIDGKRISTPQRGLNIIRTSDGTTKKIIVK